MRAACILHNDYERAGSFELAFADRGLNIDYFSPYKGEKLPVGDDYDLTMVMGGEQSVNKLEEYTYLKDEIAFISEQIKRGEFVLGVCLGAQIISKAMGAEVEKSPEEEKGFFDIDLSDAGAGDRLLSGFDKKLEAFHWHGEMPGLPSGAEVLAASEGCPRQIIKFAPNAYGFLCHLEMGEKEIKGLCNNEELSEGVLKKMVARDPLTTSKHVEILAQNFVNAFLKIRY